jgi:hypothetical protein
MANPIRDLCLHPKNWRRGQGFYKDMSPKTRDEIRRRWEDAQKHPIKVSDLERFDNWLE